MARRGKYWIDWCKLFYVAAYSKSNKFGEGEDNGEALKYKTWMTYLMDNLRGGRGLPNGKTEIAKELFQMQVKIEQDIRVYVDERYQTGLDELKARLEKKAEG